MFNGNQRKGLKAWVRFDGINNAVPSSFIFQKNKPKSGKWKEYVDVSLCCPSVCGGAEPLVMEVITDGQVFEFGMRVGSGNTVSGTIDWGDGTVEPFDFSTFSTTVYLNHFYDIYPDYTPHQVKVYFTDTTGFENLEIGVGDVTGSVLSVSNLQKAFPGDIIEIDADTAKFVSLDVSGMSGLQELYALECPNLSYVNVHGCTNIYYTQMFSCNLLNIDYSGCESLSYLEIYDNPNLEQVIIDNCYSLYEVDIRNCALVQSAVDSIIVNLDSFGVTGGLLDLRGGTNASPSGPVGGNIASLQSKGWLVLTN